MTRQAEMFPDIAERSRRLKARMRAYNRACVKYWMETPYGDVLECLPPRERVEYARDLNEFHLTFVGGVRRAALGIGEAA